MQARAAVSADKWLDGRRDAGGPWRINIGSGLWCQRGWRTVDLYTAGFVDHRCDLRTRPRLPFDDGTASIVFTSHLLEHLDNETAGHLLAETRRVLRSGGVLRAAVPDVGAALDAYRSGDRLFFEQGGVSCAGPTLEHLLANFVASYGESYGDGGRGPVVDRARIAELADGPIEDLVSYCVGAIPADAAYVAHVNGYDAAKLERFVREAGFEQVERSRFRASALRELRRPAFDVRPKVSLFVEATAGS